MRVDIFITPLLLLVFVLLISSSVAFLQNPNSGASGIPFRFLSEGSAAVKTEPFTSSSSITKCQCLPGFLPRAEGNGFVCLKVADMKTTLPCY